MRETPCSWGFPRNRKDRFTVVLEGTITTAHEAQEDSRGEIEFKMELGKTLWSPHEAAAQRTGVTVPVRQKNEGVGEHVRIEIPQNNSREQTEA
jgi:hypothetical protein